MNKLQVLTAAVAIVMPLAALAAPQTSDTCLMFSARNIAKGKANFFCYYAFSTESVPIRKGDVLEYDVFLDAANPVARGGVDVETDSPSPKPWLRDTDARDQNGLKAHGNSNLKQALGQWYSRRIPLNALADQNSVCWLMNFEGDAAGNYTQFIDNVSVKHADGSSTPIYTDGEPTAHELKQHEGYSKYLTVVPVPRSSVRAGTSLQNLIEHTVASQRVRADLEELRHELDLGRRIAASVTSTDPKIEAEASAKLEKMDAQSTITQADLRNARQIVAKALQHYAPQMQKYTSHLVGHGHIDFQWLWQWPETVGVCRDTFRQATKFMDEYPDFCYTQSSSALYQATEQSNPEIFRKMQKYVAQGRWELAGGTVSEADTHTISPESHARHFLYGQRYFRQRFNGKQAEVGWEPDTFGHIWTMPQILKLGGCNYLYFMRAGFNQPLFWWKGPDGSRVLAFRDKDYNGSVGYELLDEALAFEKTTKAPDALFVYGVGNHGGGPTREHIEKARELGHKAYLPKVRFSTALNFFKSLQKQDLKALPEVDTELNTTDNANFFGCYTSHSDVKRWNRDAESVTASAEAIAALLSRFGCDYPAEQFRKNWSSILWNHHHDTICGTAVHDSYKLSEKTYTEAIASSRAIGQKALHQLAALVKGDAPGLLVFNPTGSAQSGVIEVCTTGSLQGAARLVAPDGSRALLQPLADKPGRALLYARNVPSFGYRRYACDKESSQPEAGTLSVSADGTKLENDSFIVRIDQTSGVVASIYDKRQQREMITPGGGGNRLEVHWEAPNGMSAWVIGKIKRVQCLEEPVQIKVIEQGPVRASVQWTKRFGDTDLLQTVALPVQGAPEFGLDTLWKELGSDKTDSPFLKVAFDLNTSVTQTTYDIPFGNIVRPADNVDHPALTWVDACSSETGAALINDCKHGYSSTSNTLRLSLIRSSYNPDPRPNDRPQSARWALLPHGQDWRDAGVVQYADAFNRPMWACDAQSVAKGKLPAEQSLLQTPKGAVVTGVKRAEDDSDLVVRMYEPFGRTSTSAVNTPWQITRARIVNFMEDVLGTDKAAGADLRPYEIRNLKLRLAAKQ